MITDFIGQKRISQTIERLDRKSLPRTLLLVGNKGSGRHLICSMISQKLSLELIDITDDISLDKINEINSRVEPFLYIIDTKNITIKEQNVLLKFLEEPLKNAYIIVISTNTSLLDTVLSRCVVWELERYSKEELSQMYHCDDTKRELLERVVQTPGDVIEYQEQPVEELFQLGNKILDNIGRATIPNTLTLVDKFSFKKDDNKYDVQLFSRVMVWLIRERIRSNNMAYTAYTVTSDFCSKCQMKSLNLEHLFSLYLLELRDALHIA